MPENLYNPGQDDQGSNLAMTDEKVKILGISGSPRDEGTAYCVREALAAAAQLPGVETEYMSLAGKKIEPCDHCFGCRRHYQEHPGCQEYYCEKNDDMPDLIKIFLSADGYIIGSPVYSTMISGLMKSFFDRTLPLTFFATKTLKFRIGTALAVGGGRNAGQEITMLAIRHFYLTHGMIACSSGHDFKLGVAMWSKDEGAKGCSEDAYPKKQLIALGLRTAEKAVMIKRGRVLFALEG